MSGSSDRRAVWPFEDVDLGPDLAADVPPGTPPEEYPRLVARLFYRNRDLAGIEDKYGSLEGMERATAEAPAKVLPHVLWLGLRHAEAWSDLERVNDLHGSTAWSLETQVAVARAMAKALGGDADEAEQATRASLEDPAVAGEGGVRVVSGDDLEGEEPDEGPPEAVAAGA